MKKSIRVLLFVLLLFAVAGIYFYNKPHADVQSARPDYIIDSYTLFDDFEKNEISANSNYLNKVLLVKGKVREVNIQNRGMSIVLDSSNPMFGISCNMEEKKSNYKTGDQIKIKGICTGMMADVALNNCIIIE